MLSSDGLVGDCQIVTLTPKQGDGIRDSLAG